MTTYATTMAMTLHDGAERASFEFFATSLAALANNEADPKQVLESALLIMGVDKDTLLNEQASRYGFNGQREQFEEYLLAALEQQLFDLKCCRLTANDRKQRSLIAAL